MRLKVFICIALALITLGIYRPARHFDFVYYDDLLFLESPGVENGVHWDSVKWAMTAVVAWNWHPITNLSFLATRYIFGSNPGAEHLLNVFIHAANAVLLFLVMVEITKSQKANSLTSPLPSPLPSDGSGEGTAIERRTGFLQENIWPCAMVAAIFAWHPQRVESVAWIAERKDVLFMFFMLLAIFCYTKYAQRARPLPIKIRTSRTRLLMSSPSPLPSPPGEGESPSDSLKQQRSHWSAGSASLWYGLALVFFALSLMSKAMVVTLPFLLLLLDFWPLGGLRIADWGVGSGPSPHPDPLPSHPMGAEREQPSNDRRVRNKTMKATVTRLVIEKIPFFALSIVFCVLTFWAQNANSAVMPLSEVGLAARIENAILSYVYYLGDFFWPAKLSIYYQYTLNFNAVEVTLAALLLAAVTTLCVLEIRRRPYLAVGWFWYLGTMVPVIGLVQVGYNSMADRYTYLPMVGPVLTLVWLVSEWAESKRVRHCIAAAAIIVVIACGVSTRRQLSYWQNSVTLFDRAQALNPLSVYPDLPIAQGLEEQGRWREAATEFRIALTLKVPHDEFVCDIHFARVLAQLGLQHEANKYLESALEIEPNSVIALNALAWSLATDPDAHYRNGARAVELAERACQLTGYEQTYYIGTLAAAYAEAGRFDDAVATAQKAIAHAQQDNQPDLEQNNRENLKIFLAHQAYHEKAN
jgi:protein O-mannosyl-transferase